MTEDSLSALEQVAQLSAAGKGRAFSLKKDNGKVQEKPLRQGCGKRQGSNHWLLTWGGLQGCGMSQI